MWHYLYIDDNDNAFRLSKELMDEHFALLAVTRNMDTAIFSQFDQKTGGTHFYFSPGTEFIAKRHKASECEQPSRQNVGTLLCGEQTVVARLFN